MTNKEFGVCVCVGAGEGCRFLKYDPESGLGVSIIVVSRTFVIGHIYHSSDRERSDEEEECADLGQREQKCSPCIWKASGER